MNSTINFSRMAKLISEQRGEMGLRETAAAIGEVSPSTLSRIEGKRIQDMNVSTFLRICDWLTIEPSDLIITKTERAALPSDPSNAIELQLRAAKNLNPTAKRLLTEMVRAAFDDVEEDE